MSSPASTTPSSPAATRKPYVVIVMPAYNAARTLERTYADIPHELVHRIILVDDVSKDDLEDALNKAEDAAKNGSEDTKKKARELQEKIERELDSRK